MYTQSGPDGESAASPAGSRIRSGGLLEEGDAVAKTGDHDG
jgi:hypothetical protein